MSKKGDISVSNKKIIILLSQEGYLKDENSALPRTIQGLENFWSLDYFAEQTNKRRKVSIQTSTLSILAIDILTYFLNHEF